MIKNTLASIVFMTGITFVGLAYSDDGITLCSQHEDIYFSCPFIDGKIVSVCALHNTSPNSGYVQYRYGTPEKLELMYPETKSPPKNRFFYVNATEGSANRDILKFKNGKYTYIIYQAFFSGLTVLKNDSIVFNKSCESGSNAVISRKVNNGVEEIQKSKEDYR
jgi:hypothetical protein